MGHENFSKPKENALSQPKLALEKRRFTVAKQICHDTFMPWRVDRLSKKSTEATKKVSAH
jgi:hypothetical protein